MGDGSTLSGEGIHDTWRGLYRTPDVEPVLQLYFRTIADRLELTPETSILDAGCGTAFNAVRLAKMGYRIDGVDFSPYAVSEGRAFAKAAGVSDRVRLSIGDMTNLIEIEDGSYDVVMCLASLMHIPRLDLALKEVVRVLKPGGRLLIAEANRGSPGYLMQRFYWKFVSKERITVDWQGGFTNVWRETDEGRLLSRKMSIPWLVRRLKDEGLRLEWRKPVDLTELYTRTSNPKIRKVFHAINGAYFRFGGPAQLAGGNYLAFRKLA